MNYEKAKMNLDLFGPGTAGIAMRIEGRYDTASVVNQNTGTQKILKRNYIMECTQNQF